MQDELASAVLGLDYSQARALLPTWTQQCDIDLACAWLESHRLPIPPLYARLRTKPLPRDSHVAALLCGALAPLIVRHLDDDRDTLSIIYFMLTCKATWNALSGDVAAWNQRRSQQEDKVLVQCNDGSRIEACRYLGKHCISCSKPLSSGAKQENNYFVWPPRPRWAKLCHNCIFGHNYSINASRYQMINIESNFWVDLGDTYQQAVSASLPRGA